MGFIILLAFTAFAIAGSAAFFSVYGLAQIFSGSFLPIVIMAGSLEIGKLVTASYLYRYRDNVSIVMRLYMISAVIVLMGITSAGIFGFLSSAYQQDILGTKVNQQQVELLTQELIQIESLKLERLDRKKQIDNDISALPSNYVSGRKKLMDAYGSELTQLKEDVSSYTKQIRERTTKISELKAENLKQEVHVGPIIFIAKVFDRDVDDTTKWLILIIIFAFDPLAVALTIGVNVAIAERRQRLGTPNSKIPETAQESIDETTTEPTPSVNSVEQLFDQPSRNDTLERIKDALDILNDRELSPNESAQKELLEEVRRRKTVTQRVRNPK